MSGKKIERKKQKLISRSKKRKATIKQLSKKPTLKRIDTEAIKESFKKSPESK